MKNMLDDLHDKDNNKAYKTLLELEIITTESNELYNYFNELLNMLESNKTYEKNRGFRLICGLAKWDIDSKININIDKILNVFEEKNGVLVRECLKSLNLILIYKPELTDRIEETLKSLDLSKYKDSMQSLIKKDIDYILNNL